MSAIKLISSMAPRELLKELTGQFSANTAKPVEYEAAGGVEVAKRVRRGEPFDAVVLARNAIDELAKDDLLAASSITDIAQSGIAVAVRADAKLPDISNEAAVKRAILAAKSVSYSTGPSGVYLEKKFAAWGILETVRPRIVVPPPGTAVGSLVASGDVALGFQQLSELIALPGIRVVGSLPAELQLVTVFSGALTRNASERQAVLDMLQFMAAPQNAPLKRRFGMEAVEQQRVQG
jgi:molybdate transport system substrate-binding protein